MSRGSNVWSAVFITTDSTFAAAGARIKADFLAGVRPAFAEGFRPMNGTTKQRSTGRPAMLGNCRFHSSDLRFAGWGRRRASNPEFAICNSQSEICNLKSKIHRRRAFTLVEMLVVISIIAVLAALLLPAVNMAREAGRRASCSNNLRNLAIAAQQFDSAKGYYPASRTFWNSPTYTKPASFGTQGAQTLYLSWAMELMPYYEKQDVRAFVEAAVSNGQPIFNAANGKMNLLLCPSDELDDPTSTPNNTPYAQLSYAC